MTTTRTRTSVTDFPLEMRRQALDWYGRMDAGDIAEHDRAAFEAWLSQDERHAQAYDRATTLWQGFGTLDYDQVDPRLSRMSFGERLRDARFAFPVPSQFKQIGFMPVATVVTVLAICVGALSLAAPWRAADTPASTTVLAAFETQRGQTRSVVLADSSQVTLGPLTQIEVELTDAERRVRLASGSAVFTVTPDRARPFYVEAQQLTVKVVGTVFDVRKYAGVVRLSVQEGIVEAAHPIVVDGQQMGIERKQRVSSGEQIAATTQTGLTAVETFRVESFASWTKARLNYVNTPLAEFIADVNRYSIRPIELIDEPGALDSLTVTFSFDGNDIDGMLKVLPNLFPVMVDRSDAERIVIRAGKKREL